MDGEHERWWRQAGSGELRQLLFWRWDPIGVADEFPLTAAEYDSYVEPLATLLRDGASAALLARHLGEIERDEMGFEGRSDPLDVAELLLRWYAESLDLWRRNA